GGGRLGGGPAGRAGGADVGVVLLPAGARVGVVEFLPRPAGRSADDHVVVLRLAEVDPRLVYAQLTPRREVALHVVRGAAAGHGVLLGGHEPETVRVHQVGVDPIALAGRRPRQPRDRHRQVLRPPARR